MILCLIIFANNLDSVIRRLFLLNRIFFYLKLLQFLGNMSGRGTIEHGSSTCCVLNTALVVSLSHGISDPTYSAYIAYQVLE